MAGSIPSELFSWHGDIKTFTAEVSDLTGNGFPVIPVLGFFMKSQWTGKEMFFRCVDRVVDSEGEVLYWKFESENNRLAVEIFND